MRDNLETILDTCISRIKGGETDVQGCLAQYPEYADQLRPLLDAAIYLMDAPEAQPSSEAVAQGQERLLLALERKRTEAAERGSVLGRLFGSVARVLRLSPDRDGISEPPGPGPKPTTSLWPRLAAALAVMLVIVLGGGGVVIASDGALPGDLLYPVKRTTESVRLALTFSDTAKAELHLDFAERRVEELTEAALKGEPELVAAWPEKIASHLESARLAVEGKGPSGALTDLSARIEQSAISQLAVLEVVLETVPEESRAVVEGAFSKAGDGYGAAIDTLAAPPSEPLLVARLGTSQVRVTDSPAPDVDQVLIQVRNIQVHKAAGADSQWITISAAPLTFDLLRVEEIEKFLGTRMVDEGTYTQVRLDIDSVTVVVGDETHNVDLPSGRLKLVRPFKVKEGETTLLLLDFNGLESLNVTGDGRYMLRPVVKVLVPTATQEAREEIARKRGRGPDRAQPEARDEAPGSAEAPGREGEGLGREGEQPGPGSRDGLEQRGIKVEIEGPINDFGENKWVVLGLDILLDAHTEVKGVPGVGLKARVEAILKPNGDILATEIKVKEEEERVEVKIEGTIDSFDRNKWVIAGQTVLVDGQTEIKGAPEVGLEAKAEAVLLSNGDLLATEIRVRSKDRGHDEIEVEIVGVVRAIGATQWIIAGQEVKVDEPYGDKGQPRGWEDGQSRGHSAAQWRPAGH